MVGDQRAPALADDDGVGDFLRVADVHDVIDDVARVLAEGVIGGTVEGGSRAVVIDPEAAAHVEVAERVAHLGHLRVEAGGLAHGALDGADVGNLGADVEMDQLQAMGEALALERLAGGDEVRGR